jgi:hypothetical protein
VNIAGGAVNGTVVPEGIQRFLSRIRLAWDGVDIVQPIDGRILHQLTARSRAEITAATVLASGAVQVTPVAFDFVIPLAARWLAQPILTAIPGTLPVTQELALYVEFDQSVNAGAGSGAGSGAFIAGGDRAVTITNVALTLEQWYSTGVIVPWGLPKINVRTTEQFTAANTELNLLIERQDPYHAVLLRMFEGADQEAQDGFNFVSLIAGGGSVRYMDRADALMLQREDAGLFPAALTAVQPGTIFLRHADNGLLGSIVVPAALPDPRYVFDVDAPVANPGVIQATFIGVTQVPGITAGLQ